MMWMAELRGCRIEIGDEPVVIADSGRFGVEQPPAVADGERRTAVRPAADEYVIDAAKRPVPVSGFRVVGHEGVQRLARWVASQASR